MSPSLQRTLRTMSAALAILLSVALAGVAAWLVRRHEHSREPMTTACADATTAVFADGAGATFPDTVLLERLLAQRDRCIDDPVWADQARRLMTNTQRFRDARALLEAAEQRRTFAPDELAAELAWVDLTESHHAWTEGDQAKAESLHARGTAEATRLRDRWPEWPLPRLLLDEAAAARWLPTSSGPGSDHFWAGEAARKRIVTGAFARSLDGWQPSIAAFVGVALGLLALAVGVGSVFDLRALTRQPLATIGSARPGYVKLAGTVHTIPGASPVIAPLSHDASVWYELETRSGTKNPTTRWERSAQPFVIRDATGEAVIEPRELSVRTRLSSTSFDTRGSMGLGRRATERRLAEGDRVVVLGELVAADGANGRELPHVRVSGDGRQLLVSTFDESTLIFVERIWIGAGVGVFVLCTCVLAWAWYQRYHVVVTPGTI